jgi:hypothetical protein
VKGDFKPLFSPELWVLSRLFYDVFVHNCYQVQIYRHFLELTLISTTFNLLKITLFYRSERSERMTKNKLVFTRCEVKSSIFIKKKILNE